MLTLIFTGWAARSAAVAAQAARKAADDASESITAAKDSAAATKIAAEAAGRHADIAEKTAKYQLRAYLGARPFYTFRFSVWHRGGIKAELKNFGQTPAHDVSTLGVCDIFPYPLPDDFQFPVVDTGIVRSKHIIFPGETFFVDSFAPRIFSPIEVQQAAAGTEFRLYIFGLIKYSDEFGGDHQTKFCASVAGGPNLAIVVWGGEVTPEMGGIFYERAAQHNEAT